MIPRIIWQTHEWEEKDIPAIWLKHAKTWKENNPEFEYHYFDKNMREDYVKNSSLDMYQYYHPQKLKGYRPLTPYYIGMYQSDIWRYCLLYENGGIYADMDSACESGIYNVIYNTKKDFLLQEKELYSEEVQQDMLKREVGNNCVIACTQYNDIMLNMIEEVKRRCEEGYYIHEIASPPVFNRVIGKYWADGRIGFEFTNVKHPA